MWARIFHCLTERTGVRKSRGYTVGRWSRNRPVRKRKYLPDSLQNNIAARDFGGPSD